jgi:alkylation response protein AidB-like acyl-CoA dehydrogenase
MNLINVSDVTKFFTRRLIAAAMAELYTCEMAEEVGLGCNSDPRRYGYASDYLVEKIWRDVRACRSVKAPVTCSAS